ncbi:aminotransferase class V-fold PLP-dependent enzyme [Lacticaseibacillus sharpeae]|uniref:cysteine desulfurase n=1 Tax=Lacticaseibacillus sharpeae JCM 1186 = DSM 20505 TaxID=1291052 RepID=A0A0R1ZK43_9LACO|nr:aminotransferase class V-fold PLP-dependent enzyme [Lacticaseibacillus sharpeae]KRM55320.1 cysteine desulfurase [Lacticaseibacillus sharpeae JCM 1186 = DSM 20505]
MANNDSEWRADFPLFQQHPELAYFDQAATGQYPQSVIDALNAYMTGANAPLHRGLYKLAYAATEQFESVRSQVAEFLHAQAADEIVFTSGTTAALNLVAQSFGNLIVDGNSEIIVSIAEHHSNFLPWQHLAETTGAKLLIAPVTADGAIDEDWVLAHIGMHTRIVALAQETNVTGAQLQQVRTIADRVHGQGGYLVLDGAQAVAHTDVDVQALGCDFYAFSGHKIYGPSGIGVLYGRRELLVEMPPVTLGGGMINEVTTLTASFAPAPLRFEAGSQNALGVIGLGAAIEYLQPRRAAITAYLKGLTSQVRSALAELPAVTLYSSPAAPATVSFNVDGVHAHDVATFLDEADVAVRAGHHCAQPLMHALGVSAVVRATLGAYTTEDDCQRLIAGVREAAAFFAEARHES